NVYCFADGASCFGGLFCIDGGDDLGAEGCPGNPLATSVTWEAAPNTTYVILVAGRAGEAGTYELSVTGQASADAPAPCEECEVDTSLANLFENESCGDETNNAFPGPTLPP